MKTMLKNLGAPFQFALLTVKSAYLPIFHLCSGIKLVMSSDVVSNPTPPIRMLWYVFSTWVVHIYTQTLVWRLCVLTWSIVLPMPLQHMLLLFPSMPTMGKFLSQPSEKGTATQAACPGVNAYGRRAEQSRHSRAAPRSHASCRHLTTAWLQQLCSISTDATLSCVLCCTHPSPAPLQNLTVSCNQWRYQRKVFNPREVTPVRLSPELCALAEGKGVFCTSAYFFARKTFKTGLLSLPGNSPAWRFSISQRSAHFQRGHPRGRRYLHTGCL